MLNSNLVEWIGYAASILVAISLLMTSLIKLRWYNLIGSLVFSIYGFLIGSLPTGFLNAFIVVINVFYLFKMYSQKESFKIVEFTKNDNFVINFFEYYKDDIKKYFPNFKLQIDENTLSFCVLRNMVPAGIFIGTRQTADTLFIELDFATPAYRDFKIGKYIFNENEKHFSNLGYKRFIASSSNEVHNNYLKKMGFIDVTENGQSLLMKEITK